MTKRRTWTSHQDDVLKYLKQQCKIKKWSKLSQIMETEYKILGRCGKQCRERYNHHLKSQISQKKMSRAQQLKLLKLHEQIGNKTSNFLKNQLYSKVRKAVRNINRWTRKNQNQGATNQEAISLGMVYQLFEANDFKFSKDAKLLLHPQNLQFFSSLKNIMIRITNCQHDQADILFCGNPLYSQLYKMCRSFETVYSQCKSIISKNKQSKQSNEKSQGPNDDPLQSKQCFSTPNSQGEMQSSNLNQQRSAQLIYFQEQKQEQLDTLEGESLTLGPIAKQDRQTKSQQPQTFLLSCSQKEKNSEYEIQSSLVDKNYVQKCGFGSMETNKVQFQGSPVERDETQSQGDGMLDYFLENSNKASLSQLDQLDFCSATRKYDSCLFQ